MYLLVYGTFTPVFWSTSIVDVRWSNLVDCPYYYHYHPLSLTMAMAKVVMML